MAIGKRWKRKVTETSPDTANHNAGRADFVSWDIIVEIDVKFEIILLGDYLLSDDAELP